MRGLRRGYRRRGRVGGDARDSGTVRRANGAAMGGALAAGAAPEKVFALLPPARARPRWGPRRPARACTRARSGRGAKDGIVARGAGTRRTRRSRPSREKPRGVARRSLRGAPRTAGRRTRRERRRRSRAASRGSLRGPRRPRAPRRRFSGGSRGGVREASEEASSDGADSDGILDFSDEEAESPRSPERDDEEGEEKEEGDDDDDDENENVAARMPISPPARSAADDRFASFPASVVATAKLVRGAGTARGGPRAGRPRRRRGRGAPAPRHPPRAPPPPARRRFALPRSPRRRRGGARRGVSAAAGPDLHATPHGWSRRVEVMEAECGRRSWTRPGRGAGGDVARGRARPGGDER